MTTATRPPRIVLTWTATSLTTGFGGYNVYRRPSRNPVAAWVQIGAITVPTGFTAANVEAQHNSFYDYEAGWAITGGQWQDGWDYAVTVVSAQTNLESVLSTVQARIVVSADQHPWVASNLAPYLSFPIQSMQQLDSSDEPSRTEYRIAGRDLAVARTMLELPPRGWSLAMRIFDRLGEDPARVWRAAAASGLPMAALTSMGDRLIGVLEAPSALPHEAEGTWTLTGDILESSRGSSGLADYNRPAGLVTDGAASYAKTLDDASLHPGGVGFTIFCTAQFSSVASKYALAKINAGQGFAFGTDGSGHMRLEVNGSSTSGTVVDSTGVYNDNVHGLIATVAPGAQAMYRDGVQVATGAVAYGTITSTDPLTVGAKSSFAAFMALAPARSWGYYPRILTAAEIANLHNYLSGRPGVRPPSGASLFMDLRDNRCWDGTQAGAVLFEQSGSALATTLVGTPVTRGIPWNLAQIDRF